MKKEEDAFALAKEMVMLGRHAGRKTTAVISDMDEPLGFAIGNALEVKEAIETLKGNGPQDFTQLCMELGAQMLLAGKAAEDTKQAYDMLRGVIESGAALRNKKRSFERSSFSLSFA